MGGMPGPAPPPIPFFYPEPDGSYPCFDPDLAGIEIGVPSNIGHAYRLYQAKQGRTGLGKFLFNWFWDPHEGKETARNKHAR